MPRKTTRLYYGVHPETGDNLYWVVKVTNAKRAVKLNGTVKDAMTGEAGVSIGCHLSNTARANKSAFPHPALYISFTKSVALVITRIAKGQPQECVRYRHGYSKYVDLNDKHPDKAIVAEHPHLFNRQFTLGPYKTQENHWKPEYGRKVTGERAERMAKGELARLKAAKLVIPNLSA